MVYLTNMNAKGAEKSVNEFYHEWFTNGSPLWDNVNTSTYGPAPGFLIGGPTFQYNWDDAQCSLEINATVCKRDFIITSIFENPIQKK